MNSATLDPGNPGRNDSAARPRRDPDSTLVELVSMHSRDGQAMTRSPWGGRSETRLTPRQPPGRCNQKARAYAAEIVRLRELGYTFGAIREALADIGVKVSISTVRRETIRRADASPAATPVAAVPPG